MTITLDNLVHQPGNTRDVTISQMVDVVFNHSKPPAYTRSQVVEIATAWARFSDIFGFPRSQTWGQGPGHETGWFWSRVEINQVQPDQNNWGGLGADNTGAAGASFGPVDGFTAYEHGALAFMCHYALYVWGEPERWPDHLQKYSKYAYRLNDVRRAHNNVKKPDGKLLRHFGVVKRIGDFLNGRWARTDQLPLGTLENGYARGIVAKANEVRAMPAEPRPEPSTPTAPYSNIIAGLIDVRDQLAINTGKPSPFGPSRTLSFGQKRGVVFHYNGPPVNPPGTLAAVKAFARYHVNRNWARPGNPAVYGDGLMYHIAIGADGEKWLCRDLEAMLWHCGVTHWNERALSVQMIIGDGQRVTPAQIKAAHEVADDWCAFTGTPRFEVWGHYELSPTSCPGTVQQDIVLPYRNRKDKSVADGYFFGETGHFVGGGFWQFWRERGGLPVFGYPLSDEFDAISTDPGTQGRRITVQVFERAVFEYHPGNAPPNDILLRRLGAEALEEILKEKAA